MARVEVGWMDGWMGVKWVDWRDDSWMGLRRGIKRALKGYKREGLEKERVKDISKRGWKGGGFE